MLINLKIQNYFSFNTEQTLNMLASTSTNDDKPENIFSVGKFGIDKIVKSVAIFGANASGKTNLATGFSALKLLVLESLKNIDSDTIDITSPFLIKDNVHDIPTEFEITFIENERLFRYGIAIDSQIISEEWLYWTNQSRETLLFHRTGQQINFNQRSFAEARHFVTKTDETWTIEKTKPTVPFISVLAQFNGDLSSQIANWFKKINVIFSTTNDGTKNFTTNLLKNDPAFKDWVVKILSSFQIQDIQIVEIEKSPKDYKITNKELLEVASQLNSFIKNNKLKSKQINIIKKTPNSTKTFEFPIDLESEGTCKFIYLLGPIYDSIKNNKLLIIDEFDNKFHTLLSEFLISLYHRENTSHSQLILTCHDTNLLDKSIFRRDQIWFVEKNERHESELYSLLEYKEHYTRKNNNYSKDYLAGKYGAIPLFPSPQSLNEVLGG